MEYPKGDGFPGGATAGNFTKIGAKWWVSRPFEHKKSVLKYTLPQPEFSDFFFFDLLNKHFKIQLKYLFWIEVWLNLIFIKKKFIFENFLLLYFAFQTLGMSILIAILG